MIESATRPSAIRVQILSDLHYELRPQAAPHAEALQTDADLVIIAGDLARAPDTVSTAARLFPDTPVVMVAGNHEHYQTGMDVDAGIKKMREEAGRVSNDLRPIHVLENDALLMPVGAHTVRLLGCTLWTDFCLVSTSAFGKAACLLGMNDFRGAIRGKAPERYFSPEHAAALHAGSRAFLARELATELKEGPTVVVTHHGPSIRSVAPRWLSDPITAGFSSNLDAVLDLGTAALWAHGHTHDSHRYRSDGGTLVICNPAGYAKRSGNRENAAFDPRLVVELRQTATGWSANLAE